jgi:hypothetical protein
LCVQVLRSALRQLPINAIAGAEAARNAGSKTEIKRNSPVQFYHDFSVLGLDLPQLPGAYAQNQAS